MLAPAGIPVEVITKLETALLKTAAMPVFRQKLLDAGLEPEPLGTKEFAARLQVEIPRLARIVKLSGAKVE